MRGPDSRPPRPHRRSAIISLSLLSVLVLGAALLHGRGRLPSPTLRTVWGTTCLYWLVGLASGNGWIMACLGVMGFNFLRDPYAGQKAGAVGMTLSMLAACLYIASQGSSAWVEPTLMSLVAVGVILAIWALVSWWHYPHRYRYFLSHVGFYEERDSAARIEVGQSNQNHAHALTAVCVAAACGLGWTHSALWFWLLLILVIPMLAVDWTVRHKAHGLAQGHLYLWHLVLLGLALWWGWWSLVVLVPYLGFCVMAFWRYHGVMDGPDTGRFRRWYILLGSGAIRQPWFTRLFGQGWRTWTTWAEQLVKADTARFPERQHYIRFMTTAHNEFVQFWFEHGAVGLVCLLGFCGWAFWHVWSAGAYALIPVMVVVGSIACLSMPWSLYHEVIFDDEKAKTRTTSGVGFPALQAISLVLAILIMVV